MLALLILTFSLQSTLVWSNVIFDFQIDSYLNPTKSPNGSACFCEPRSSYEISDCSYLNFTSKCHIQFTVWVTTVDATKGISRQTNYSILNLNGELDEESRNIWNQKFTWNLKYVPWEITVYAVNFGSFITPAGEQRAFNSELLADDFKVQVTDLRLSTSRNLQSVYKTELKGKKGTTLTATYTITCLGPLVGPVCDLNCTKLENANDWAHCKSVLRKVDNLWKCRQSENGTFVDQCEMFTPEEKKKDAIIENSNQVEHYDEWKRIGIEIGVLLLVGTLAFLLGIKISRRSAKDKKNKEDVSASYSTLVTL